MSFLQEDKIPMRLPWFRSQAPSANVPQAVFILMVCVCAVLLVAYLLDVLVGLGFDLLPGGTR